jgi:hypothetical protein
MEGWREAMRIGFEYCILRAVGIPPLLSKVCKVFEGDTLGLDFGFGEVGGWRVDGLSVRCVCQGCVTRG